MVCPNFFYMKRYENRSLAVLPGNYRIVLYVTFVRYLGLSLGFWWTCIKSYVKKFIRSLHTSNNKLPELTYLCPIFNNFVEVTKLEAVVRSSQINHAQIITFSFNSSYQTLTMQIYITNKIYHSKWQLFRLIYTLPTETRKEVYIASLLMLKRKL